MYTHTSHRSFPCCHPYPDSPQGFVNPDLAAASSLPQRCSSWSPWLQAPAELIVLTVVLMIDICRGSPAPIGWGPRPPLWNFFAVCFHSIALAYFAPFLTLPLKFLHHEAACRSWHAPYPAVAPICALQILFLLPRTLSLPTPLPSSCLPLMPPLRRSLLPRTPTTPSLQTGLVSVFCSMPAPQPCYINIAFTTLHYNCLLFISSWSLHAR